MGIDSEVMGKLLELQTRVVVRTRLDACDRALAGIIAALKALAGAREVFELDASRVEWICEDEAYLLAMRGCAEAHRAAGRAYRNFQAAFEAVPPEARQDDLEKLAASFTVERHALSMYDAAALRRLARSYSELEGEPYLFERRAAAHAADDDAPECEGP